MSYLAIIPLLFALIYVVYRRLTRISISDIRGPASQSFLVGNLHEFFTNLAGESDFRWQELYGDIVRLKAPLGEDRLLISDPKALNYIYGCAGYDFVKPPARRELARAISGYGVTWAEGESHRRQRKIIAPGFGTAEAKASYPVFRRCAIQVCDKWKEILERNLECDSAVLNVSYWFSRAALDAIGEAAFDYRFRTLENDRDILGRAYFRLTISTYGLPTKLAILFQGLTDHLPDRLVRFMFDHAPMKGLAHARKTAKIANRVAKKLIDSKLKQIEHGEIKHDILSVLVKSNIAADESMKLSVSEIVSQMRTMMFTGHETSANSLSWLVLELARNKDIQNRLRQEIRQAEQAIRARGDQEFTVNDLEKMTYLNAVIKESLRMNPVGLHSFRQAAKDCVLPLSKPLLTSSGRWIDELPIPQGVHIVTSIIGYNRNKEVFGEDSHTFNPDRWLRSEGMSRPSGQKVGVYNDLLTFSGGVRTCPGWRMAVIEVQAFIVELINTFEFDLTEEARRVRRENALVMVPTVPDQLDKGPQLPLRIRLAARE